MPYRSLKYSCAVIILITAFCCQFGCSANKYRAPISNFQTATAVVTAHTRTALNELNQQQRLRVVQKKRQDNSEIRVSDIDGSRLILPKDLNARLDALDRLNEYVDLLARIANSDAPENIAKSATDLTGAIGNLTGTINGLAGNSNTNFKNAFGVAGAVISEVLRFIAQQKIKEAVETAVLKGEVPINNLIDAIGNDLEVAFLVRKANLEEDRADLHKKYNLEVVKNPRDEKLLDKLTEKILAIADALDTLAEVNPRAALNAMAKAHTKLVLHAKGRNSASFESATEAIEIFAAAAKRLGEAVLKLKTQTA